MNNGIKLYISLWDKSRKYKKVQRHLDKMYSVTFHHLRQLHNNTVVCPFSLTMFCVCVWILPRSTGFSFCQWPFWKAVTACSFINSPSIYGPHVSKTSRNLNGFTILEPAVKKHTKQLKNTAEGTVLYNLELECLVTYFFHSRFSGLKVCSKTAADDVITASVKPINNPVNFADIVQLFCAGGREIPLTAPFKGPVCLSFHESVFKYATQGNNNVFHHFLQITVTYYILPSYVSVWAALSVALNLGSVGWCLWRPTCFHLGSQDSLWSERQQADDVAHRAVGMFSKVFSQLQGIVSGKETEKNKITVQPQDVCKHAGDTPTKFEYSKGSTWKHTHLSCCLKENTVDSSLSPYLQPGTNQSHISNKSPWADASSPGLQRDGEGQTLQDGLFKQRLAALDHQVKTHRLSTCTLPKYCYLTRNTTHISVNSTQCICFLIWAVSHFSFKR